MRPGTDPRHPTLFNTALLATDGGANNALRVFYTNEAGTLTSAASGTISGREKDTRGAFIGARIHKLLCEVGGREYADGTLDISFHRDDIGLRPVLPLFPFARAPP